MAYYFAEQLPAVQNKTNFNLNIHLAHCVISRLDGPLQQMLREMKSLFGDDLWKHVVIGVSFWSFTQSDINVS